MTFVHCQEAMATGCTGMNALGISDQASAEKKMRVCRLCIQEARATERLGVWETRWLVPQLGAPKKKLASEIPRMAAYELLLQKKIESIPKKGPFREIWRKRQDRLWGILPQAERLLSEKKIDGVVCYNSLYGVHHLFLKLAKEKGIPTLCLHHSFNCAREDEYVLFRGHVFEFLNRIRASFDAGRPLTLIEKRAVEDHSRALMAGRKPWAYSLPVGNREPNRVKTKFTRKVLVCLSSPDENFAAEFLGVLPSRPKHAFPDQLAWTCWIRRLACQNPEVLFWIRPHPRLYPNKREGQRSELAEKLQKERNKQSPPNFFWPDQEQQGSVWQHLNNTDLLFNAWSTLADEFGKRGIPVITFFPFFGNSQHLIDKTSGTIQGYEKLFKQALKLGRSEKAQKLHFRWLADYLGASTISLRTKPGRIFRLVSRFQSQLGRRERFFWALIRTRGNRQLQTALSKILISEL